MQEESSPQYIHSYTRRALSFYDFLQTISYHVTHFVPSDIITAPHPYKTLFILLINTEKRCM